MYSLLSLWFYHFHVANADHIKKKSLIDVQKASSREVGINYNMSRDEMRKVIFAALHAPHLQNPSPSFFVSAPRR